MTVANDITAEPKDSPTLTPRRFLNNDNFGYFSIPFEKFREDALSEWTSTLTLLGVWSKANVLRSLSD